MAALQTIREVGDGSALSQAIDRAFPGAILEIEHEHARFEMFLQMPGFLRRFDAREFSDGTLHYLALLATLLTPRQPDLIAINEPEASIHPDLTGASSAESLAKSSRSATLYRRLAPVGSAIADHPGPISVRNSGPYEPQGFFNVPTSPPRKDSTAPENDQGRAWSRQATRYDDLFLDPFRPGVESPLLPALEALERPETLTVADLGCGTGPLLSHLISRFGRVIAIDFAPGMLTKAKKRLGTEAAKVEFLNRPMHALEDLVGALDVAIAVNSIVMPDVREIDRTLAAIRTALRPDGVFFAVLPAMDAIHYHTMILHDHALDRGLDAEAAERHAAFHAEHHFYDFAFGRFKFLGLRQKFWQPFEATHRFAKAGFREVTLGQVFYPWDESIAGFEDFTHLPRSWDWFVSARP